MRTSMLVGLFALASTSVFAQTTAESRIWELDQLRGLREIALYSETQIPARCGVSNEDVRASAINKIVPAGLIVRDFARYALFIDVLGLYMDALDICAASIHVSLRKFHAITLENGNVEAAHTTILDGAVIASDNR